MFLLYRTVLICSGYVFLSLFCSFIISALIPAGKVCKQITGFSMEFSSGFTVAVLFLSLIPSAYAFCSILELISFFVLGVFVAMLFQEKLKYQYRVMSEQRRLSATGALTTLSFAVSGIIRGLSVGTGFGLSAGLGIGLGVASAISSFPDGSAIFLMNKSAGKPFVRRFFGCFILSLPFVLGALIGIHIGNADDLLFVRMLIFSGGVTLYSAVGDMSIESKILYHGRFIPIFNIAGMILGTVLILMG